MLSPLGLVRALQLNRDYPKKLNSPRLKQRRREKKRGEPINEDRMQYRHENDLDSEVD
jgi:hypothetical protein